MPTEVENLISIARIKNLAKDLKISKIASKNINQTTTVLFTFEKNVFDTEYDKQTKIDLNQIIQKYGNKIKFSNGIKPMITLKIEKQNEHQILEDTTKFLTGVKESK